jgi:hypothetical protein
MNFITQSNLQIDSHLAKYDFSRRFLNSVSTQISLKFSLIYLAIWGLGLIVFFFNPTLGLGVVMPGGGFAASSFPLLLMTLTLIIMGLTVFLWFATGNVLGPFVVWALAAAVSLRLNHGEVSPLLSSLIFAAGPLLLMGLWVIKYVTWRWQKFKLQKLNTNLSENILALNLTERPQKEGPLELTSQQMGQLRFFLDRALQPVSEFEGFEHLDDFQTAAVRYQINFISYALSMVQYKYLPALGAYLTDAQTNLKAKQEQPEIWRYWAKESLWGNLEISRDPIAKDNIMYSGFVATQMMMALKASPHSPDNFMGDLSGKDKGFAFSYTQETLILRLTTQYENAKFGLLPCEPNWIYPLCNFITAVAIRAYDTEHHSQYWTGLEKQFRKMADKEFLGHDGHFIPFKSSYTGLNAPQIGGLIMQTFPCFFLNVIYPDIAQRQWYIMRKGLEKRSLRRACWPIDVGNYKFSRAAAYGASALAAAEMGDADLKYQLLGLMNEDCAPLLDNGRYYYSKASLWANANAFMASLTSKGDFKRLMNNRSEKKGPFIKRADPNEILFSSAYQVKGHLFFTAHPQKNSEYKCIQVAGLKPKASYHLVFKNSVETIIADHRGEADINFALSSPQHFKLIPKP